MRTRSPNFMNGVVGLPLSMVSSVRLSARQAEPTSPLLFDTVPEPTIVPAASARVLAACAISCGEREGHVDAGIGAAERRAV